MAWWCNGKCSISPCFSVPAWPLSRFLDISQSPWTWTHLRVTGDSKLLLEVNKCCPNRSRVSQPETAGTQSSTRHHPGVGKNCCIQKYRWRLRPTVLPSHAGMQIALFTSASVLIYWLGVTSHLLKVLKWWSQQQQQLWLYVIFSHVLNPLNESISKTVAVSLSTSCFESLLLFIIFLVAVIVINRWKKIFEIEFRTGESPLDRNDLEKALL